MRIIWDFFLSNLGVVFLVLSNILIGMVTYLGTRQKNKADFHVRVLEAQNRFIDQYQEQIEELKKDFHIIREENKSLQARVNELILENQQLCKKIVSIEKKE